MWFNVFTNVALLVPYTRKQSSPIYILLGLYIQEAKASFCYHQQLTSTIFMYDRTTIRACWTAFTSPVNVNIESHFSIV